MEVHHLHTQLNMQHRQQIENVQLVVLELKEQQRELYVQLEDSKILMPKAHVNYVLLDPIVQQLDLVHQLQTEQQAMFV